MVSIDFVYYLIADGIVDDVFPILDRIAEELEDSVLATPRPDDLHRMFELKRHLVSMRKVLSPQRDVFGLLSKRGDPRVSERTARLVQAQGLAVRWRHCLRRRARPVDDSPVYA